MSTARERERQRRRRAREYARDVEPAVDEQAPAAAPVAAKATGPTPLPDWNWRTFPVFFALSIGLFLGVYLGVLVNEVNDSGNGWPMLVAFLGVAILVGLGLSRLTTRWMMSRNWVKPKPQKKR